MSLSTSPVSTWTAGKGGPASKKTSPGHVDGLVGTFLVQPSVDAAEDKFAARFGNFLEQLVTPGATLLERPILPPNEWLADSYYSGPLRRELWDQKIEDFCRVAPGSIFEVIVTGSIGWGKTLIVKALCMYDLYRMSCFVEPQRVMGIGSAETIVMVLVSLNVNKAKAKLLTPLRAALDLTPYFRREFRYDPNKTAFLEFPKGIVVKSGVTGESAVHSEDVAWLGLSEANFLPVIANSRRKRGTETLDVAEDLVEATIRRMKSRFQQGKDLMGLCRLVIDSSRQYPDDYVERRIAAIHRGEVTHGNVIISHPIWAAKRGVKNAAGDLIFKGEKFPVEIGNEQRFSRILTPEEVPYAKNRIVWCADELRIEFERDIEGSLRDFAGEAVLTLKPLISNRDAIIECVRDEPEWPAYACEHPFTVVSSTLRDTGRFIEEYLVDPATKLPRVNSEKLRCAHVDFAITGDRLGFAMGHVYDVTTVQRGGAEVQMLDLPCTSCRGEKAVPCTRCSGKGIMSHFGHKTKCAVCRGSTILPCMSCKGTGKHGTPVDRPIIYIDFMLQVVPPDNGQIQFDDIEALLTSLRGMGFIIPVVTADGYESTQFLQRQMSRGGARFAEELSVDKTKDPYYALRNAIYDKDVKGRRRLSVYGYSVFHNELIRVEDRPQKIDHVHGGSKDCTDAVAGVVFNCERIPSLQAPINGSSIRVFRL